MQAARIRFRKPSCVFASRCENIALKRGDTCVVKTDRGLEFGVCVVPPESCPDEMEKTLTVRVVRKANQQDDTTFHQLQLEGKKAREFCARKIQERGLPMKLVEAEYTFDKRKIIFYFTADDRVDFRELVRDLAHELRARIELRHIQVRDEAKLVGGLGPCGLELCCAKWINEFAPISMKMAKRQNLSLNPAKISGQCGRLMCCLGYECTSYPAKRKTAEGEVIEEEVYAADLESDEEIDEEALLELERLDVGEGVVVEADFSEYETDAVCPAAANGVCPHQDTEVSEPGAKVPDEKGHEETLPKQETKPGHTSHKQRRRRRRRRRS